MDVKSIISAKVNQNNNGQKVSNNGYQISYGLRMSSPMKADSLSFTARLPKLPPAERMAAYAVKLLEEVGLKEDQPLHITAESKYVPFLRVITEEAYKKGSGKISLKIVEPELEALKQKYNIVEEFDWQKEARQEIEDSGALKIKFGDTNCPYKASGLNKKEILSQIASLYPKIPASVKKILKLNPEELFKTALDMHEGEPVIIRGEREHLPHIIKMVDWLYSKNNTKLVNVRLTEAKEFDSSVAFYKYGKDNLIGKYLNSSISKQKEMFEKDVALLALEGEDPEFFSEVDSKKIVEDSKPYRKAILEYYNKTTSNNPWLVYFAPTTKSIRLSYSEFGDNTAAALKQAYKEANLVNRVGKLKEHVANIEFRAKKMNELLDKGCRTIHYVSVDPVTKLPDGKTDLKIGLSPKSFFNGARIDMKTTGHKPIVNVPTEEVFTSPEADTAEGWVSATMPLVLNGKVVEGIRMRFEGGKIVELDATKNLEMLKEHIAANENADRLGEVALVAGSPIFKLGRLHYSTLLDENAACHIAIGDAYTDVVKGADEILDYEAQQEYLKSLRINSSTTHNDFMIGGPNVYVYAENPKTGEQVQVIKDDKFIL